jgi:DNA polymerase I-like protein with 3'-5' exonuclease and polymerase domains
MEKNGVNLDPFCLNQYSSVMEKKLKQINSKAAAILKYSINLASPKQVYHCL